jgi:hypothetical protein
MTHLKSPAFKTLTLLALSLLALAFAQSASAQDVPWSATSGSAKVPLDKIPGFFIWHVKNEVYVTTANINKKGDLFYGKITIAGGGKISGVTGTQLEKNDYITKSSATKLVFQFHTYKGHDGVHFKLTGGTTLSFQVTENGFPAQSILYYGSGKTHYTGSADPVVFNLTE